MMSHREPPRQAWAASTRDRSGSNEATTDGTELKTINTTLGPAYDTFGDADDEGYRTPPKQTRAGAGASVDDDYSGKCLQPLALQKFSDLCSCNSPSCAGIRFVCELSFVYP